MHCVTEMSFGKLWCCAFYNHLYECSQGMNWCEGFSEGLVLSGKNKINLLKMHLKERKHRMMLILRKGLLAFQEQKAE